MSLTGSTSRLVLGRLVPTVMYDSVTIEAIPVKAKAVAGYIDGKYQTYEKLNGKHRHVVSIAVFHQDDAHALDIEPSDATVSEAAAWYRRQIVGSPSGFRPIFYTSLAQAQSLVDELAAQHIDRRRYRLWTAHYTGHPHRCTRRCGFNLASKADATQWTNKALGRNLDESLLALDFFHKHR